jgi:hypothetical protein
VLDNVAGRHGVDAGSGRAAHYPWTVWAPVAKAGPAGAGTVALTDHQAPPGVGGPSGVWRWPAMAALSTHMPERGY